METSAVIRQLAANLQPAQPLPRPWVRTAAWLVTAIISVTVVVLLMTPGADLRTRLGEATFLVEQLAALATGITAAIAAFATTVPGYSRRILLLPLLPLAVWLGAVGVGCVQDWMALAPSGLALQSDWTCVSGILLGGAVPALAMAVMLRRGAPLTPRVTTALGGLAVAGLGNIGVCLVESHNVNLIVLVWHGGTVAALSLLAAWAGRYLLNWQIRLGPAVRSG